MATMWRKAMLYLGLGPDDEYDEYEPIEQSRAAPTGQQPPAQASRYPATREPAPAREPDYASGAVRTLSPQPVRAQPAPGGTDPSARPRTAVVRPIQPAASVKPYVVEPTSFNEAQEVADKFKSEVPVIVNLQNVDRDLARRLIDFASGVCYGLSGQMERVANHVYLLTPMNVEVSADERRRLEERGFER
jgi:cell division inhibitor SepF